MALGCVLQTALSGMAAAEAAVAVIAHNLANAATPGFKQSQAGCATQVPRTVSDGAAPGAGGGRNPVQVGNGVLVAGAPVDFSQGSIALGGQPLDVALQGEGLFILEGRQGERLYARSGQFCLNADGELVDSGGRRVLGFQADGQFQIDARRLVPLRIAQNRQARTDSDEAARMTGFSIHDDGRIVGRFADGVARDLGQIRVARFANPSGLSQQGGNLYAAGPNSGMPVESDPGSGGAAEILVGGMELSNTDVGQNLVDLTIARTQFSAGLAALDTGIRLLDELTGLPRRR